MDPILSLVVTYGAPGLIIAVLLIVIRQLYYQNVDIQEKRINEGREAVKLAAIMTAALDRQSDLLKAALDQRNRN